MMTDQQIRQQQDIENTWHYTRPVLPCISCGRPTYGELQTRIDHKFYRVVFDCVDCLCGVVKPQQRVER